MAPVVRACPRWPKHAQGKEGKNCLRYPATLRRKEGDRQPEDERTGDEEREENDAVTSYNLPSRLIV